MNKFILGFLQAGAILALEQVNDGPMMDAYDRFCKISRFLDSVESA